MKIFFLLAGILSLTIGSTCKHSQGGVVQGTGLSGCEGLPNLKFQNENDTIDANKVAKLATDLAAAAKIDADQSKTAPASGSGSASIKGEIGKTINEHLTQSSQVSEEFWQENIVFTQCLCFLDRQSRRKDISEETRQKIITASTELAQARSEYSLQFQKKNGSSPQ